MTSFSIKAAGVLAGTLGLLLTGCASEAPRAPLRAAAAQRMTPRPAPPNAEAPAPTRSDLVAQAGAFESFVRHARAIDADFSGPAEVAQAVQTGAGHSPAEVEAGMVAFAALAALQEPRFVAAVRAQPAGDLARRIADNPAVVLGLAGGQQASARASGALYAEGQALTSEGQKVKRAAYSVQHKDWSKETASDHPAELARVKRAGSAGYHPEAGDGQRVAEALADGGSRSGPASPLVARGVALAALSLLGQEGRDRSLMSDVRTGSCLRLAKLNYHQCLASAGPHYEDIFCVGQHAMIETGQCVIEATQAAPMRVATPVRRVPVTRASYRR